MATIKWRPGLLGWHKDPFLEMKRLQREMSRLLNHFTGSHEPTAPAGVFPLLNLSEDEDNLYVRAELPGVDPGDIELTTHQDKLMVKGERKIPAEDETVSYHRREREAGRFQRVTALPVQVDTDSVTAVCKDGVLTITLPKASEAKPRQIEVQSY
jgi:HSP20 family protein